MSKKSMISLIVVIIIAAGGWYGYKYYVAYQNKVMAEKKAQEAEQAKRLAEEAKKRELEKAKKEFEALVSKMKEYYKNKNYAMVRQTAEEAKKIALARKFSLDEINKILLKMDEDIAAAELEKIEPLASDIYAYQFLRDSLTEIHKYPAIMERWDALWDISFKNEYAVLLILALQSAENGLNGDNPASNYDISKMDLSKAISIRHSKNFNGDTDKEKKIADAQKKLFFTGLEKNTRPVHLYR